MIVVSELGFGDGGHVPFNAGLLAVIRAAYPSEPLLFFGAAAHIEDLKEQAGGSLAATIKWEKITLPGSDLGYFPRLLCEMSMLRNLLATFPEDSPGLLLLTSVRPCTVVALKLVKRSRFSKIKAQVVLHGHLSGVTGKRYRRPIRRFQEMRTALTIFGNRNLQYLVLEECLRDSLVKNLPALAGSVEVVDHPLPPNETESNTGSLCNPIRFGFLGLANESKGFPIFVKLADAITREYGDKAEFHAIGRLGGSVGLGSNMAALATKPGASRVSRSAYIQGVKQLHFIVFSHQGPSYELNSSGTLLDAIAWEKPVIARKIPLFQNMFSKHGNIGYLFGDDMELREIVQQIVQRSDKSRYYQQVLNIQRARRFRAPDALAATYRRICERVTSQN